jgi:hypothetical protein
MMCRVCHTQMKLVHCRKPGSGQLVVDHDFAISLCQLCNTRGHTMPLVSFLQTQLVPLQRGAGPMALMLWLEWVI